MTTAMPSYTFLFFDIFIAGAALTGEVAASRYRAGFRECAQEIVRFLGSGAAGVPDDVRGRILSHLTRTLTTLTEQQQQHQYHHHQLQHHQPVHHLVQQSSGLVSIHHITSGPHPAFPTTTGVHQPTCLSSGLSPLASSHVSGLSGPSIMAATPASMALVSAQNSSIASLATAPTAFQTPPLNCGTNSSIKLGSNSLSAMPPGPLQVALVLTSPPASMHALPIFTPTGSGEVPPNIVSGPSVAFQTRGSPPNASADGSELLFQRQAEPRQSPLLVSSPSSPVTSGASTPAQSSRIISHEKFRRKSSSSHEPLSLPSTSHGRGVDFSTQGGLSCDDKVWRPW